MCFETASLLYPQNVLINIAFTHCKQMYWQKYDSEFWFGKNAYVLNWWSAVYLLSKRQLQKTQNSFFSSSHFVLLLLGSEYQLNYPTPAPKVYVQCVWKLSKAHQFVLNCIKLQVLAKTGNNGLGRIRMKKIPFLSKK